MSNRSHESRESFALSGTLLAAGAATLFVGTLFYIRLTPQLGLPAPAEDRLRALQDAIALGPTRMALAGGFALFGDVLLTAACIALAARRRLPDSDLERFGWTLVAVSAAVAIVFDSMMAVLLAPLTRLAEPGVFLACKAWFDFLFAAGNVPFGIGTIAVLWADMRTDAPLLPKGLASFGIAVGAVALVSGAGYVLGILVVPAAIGLTVTLGCVVFAAYGVQITRHEGREATVGRIATAAQVL
ncbi:MAG TPA: hypothetical protein VGK30_04975 [Candidatus Binatia bacterium]|jgi:hypothetical protein